MADKFNIGDIVRLKSGGPDMTVKMVVEDWTSESAVLLVGIYCDWFDGATLKSASFRKEMIINRTDEE